MSQGNTLNISTAGAVQFNGTAFTGGACTVPNGGTGQITLTNHGVLIGQGTSSIAQLAAGTAGQALQSGGASADPAYSTATFPTTAGTASTLFRSTGTNWGNTSAFKVSAASIMTNTSQTCFLVQLNTSTGNVTGDGTLVNIQFDTTIYDIGSNITLNSGGKTIFTAPTTGKYLMNILLNLFNGAADNTQTQLQLVATSRTYITGLNNYAKINASGADNGILSCSLIVDMAANDTVSLKVSVAGHGSKNVAIRGSGSATTNLSTTWSGTLIC